MIYLGILIGVLLTGWGALCVQSLAGSGSSPTCFGGAAEFCRVPGNDRVFKMTSEFWFDDSRGRRHGIPIGMLTDGASVGALFYVPIVGILVRLLISGDQFTGPLAEPALPHDGDYGRATDRTLWRSLISQDRADADRAIFEGAICRRYADGTEREALSEWRAFIVFAMLRLFGAKAWLDDSAAARSLRSSAAAVCTPDA